MKKKSFGLLAFILATMLVAFTTNSKQKTATTTYYYFEIDANGQNFVNPQNWIPSTIATINQCEIYVTGDFCQVRLTQDEIESDGNGNVRPASPSLIDIPSHARTKKGDD